MSQQPTPLYDLVVTGHTSELKVADLVQQLMTILGKKSAQLEFKLSEALIFENNSNTALEGVPREIAEHYQKKFSTALVTTEIRPTIQIVELAAEEDTPKVYHCPACGHEQPSAKNRLDMCDVCGVIGQRYSNSNSTASRLKTVIEDERRRLAQEEAQKVRESLAKAEYKERIQLRRTALKQLGVQETKQWPTWVAMIASIAALGGGGYWGYLYLNPPTENSTESTTISADTAQNQNQTLTINPALLQGNGKLSTTDQAIVLLDNGLLPDAPAITLTNPTVTNNNTPVATNSSSPLVKTHQGRGFTILMQLEELELAYPRFKRSTAQHLVDKDYLDQLLNSGQWGMGKIFIDSLTEPYERGAMYTYALLAKPELVKSQLVTQQLKTATQALPAKDEQRLFLKAAQGVVNSQADPAAKTVTETDAFKQVLQQVAKISKPEQRVPLLIRLANEQYLFDQRVGAQHLLQLAEQDLPSVTEAKRQSLAAQIAASYFIIEDEPEMLRVSELVNDPTIRGRLFQGIEQVRPLIKVL
ncbi:hypothetical protein [Thiofilum flexile]|uniref:hypothetical protein n=1 Tax=Thiofilum flexile TaxID=125627 RepID=UPI00036D10B0|nr:hypothetical protein [Thiofilum flexile]